MPTSVAISKFWTLNQPVDIEVESVAVWCESIVVSSPGF